MESAAVVQFECAQKRIAPHLPACIQHFCLKKWPGQQEGDDRSREIISYLYLHFCHLLVLSWSLDPSNRRGTACWQGRHVMQPFIPAGQPACHWGACTERNAKNQGKRGWKNMIASVQLRPGLHSISIFIKEGERLLSNVKFQLFSY